MGDATVSNPQDELLSELDPERDYGNRSVEEVKKEVTEGKLEIAKGVAHPVIRDAQTGHLVKGSGRLPTTTTVVESRSSWDRAFREAGSMYFDVVFDQLIQLCMVGNFKAIEFFMNRMGGKPTDNKDIPDGGRDAKVDAMMAQLRAPTMIHVSSYQDPSKEEKEEARKNGREAEEELLEKYDQINKQAHFEHEERKAQNKDLVDMTYEEIKALPEDTPMREQMLWSKAISEMNSRPVTINTTHLNEEEKQRLHSILDSPEEEPVEVPKKKSSTRKKQTNKSDQKPLEVISDVAHQVMIDDAIRNMGL